MSYIQKFIGVNTMNKIVTILLILVICTTEKISAQKIIDFSYSECSNNRYVGIMNPMLNKMTFNADGSLDLWFSWVTVCEFKPERPSMKIKGDTIYFSLEDKTDSGSGFCGCEYPLHFKIVNIEKRDYQIKIFDFAIDKSAKRYRTDSYTVEYYPRNVAKKTRLREIFSEEGKVIVEVYYDKEGKMTAEKFYDTGIFEKEVKY